MLQGRTAPAFQLTRWPGARGSTLALMIGTRTGGCVDILPNQDHCDAFGCGLGVPWPQPGSGMPLLLDWVAGGFTARCMHAWWKLDLVTGSQQRTSAPRCQCSLPTQPAPSQCI